MTLITRQSNSMLNSLDQRDDMTSKGLNAVKIPLLSPPSLSRHHMCVAQSLMSRSPQRIVVGNSLDRVGKVTLIDRIT